MKIIPELALAFDTKKRAPFRVVFEAVRLSELIKIKGANDQLLVVQEQVEEQKELTLDEEQIIQETQLGLTIEDMTGDDIFASEANPFASTQIKKDNFSSSGTGVSNPFEIKNTDFQGFDKFAKFVEFEEKMFDQQLQIVPGNISQSETPTNFHLKTAKSMTITGGQVDEEIQEILNEKT